MNNGRALRRHLFSILPLFALQRLLMWRIINALIIIIYYYYRKSHMVYRTAPFSMTLNDPNPDFNVTPFFIIIIITSLLRVDRMQPNNK